MNSLNTVSTQQKYGLIKKGSTATNAIKRPVLSAFQLGDDECDDDDNDIIDGGCSGSFKSKKAQESNSKEISRANKQLLGLKSSTSSSLVVPDVDPSIYAYDEVYDSMKNSSAVSHPLSRASAKDVPKPQYISNLKVAAALREKENDRVYEKKLLKERKVEDEQFGDQPMFVTAAYKEKLIERQKWEMEEKLQEELEKQNDVKKRGMESFYSNFLTKNIAVGSDVSKTALSAFTTGSQRQENLIGSAPVDTSGIEQRNIASEKLGIPYEDGDSGDLGDSYLPADKRVRILEPDSEEIIVLSELPIPAAVADVHSILATESDNKSISGDISAVEKSSKVEQIVSAKERYLARKLNKSLEKNS